MFGSNVVEIGIGLVFTYLLLSLVVTAANELLATLVRSRAKDLERGICNLLDGKSDFPDSWMLAKFRWFGNLFLGASAKVPTPTPGTWSQQFFAHHLVDALSKDGEKPSYIPARTFAQVLLHLVNRDSTGVPGQPPLWGFDSFDQIQKVIEGIGNPGVRDVLLNVLEEARADMTDGVAAVKKFSDRIEIWFNQAMDRVSGWYIRRTRWFLFLFAVVFTSVLNVDTISIARRLGKDDTLRASLVEAAKEYSARAAASQAVASGPSGAVATTAPASPAAAPVPAAPVPAAPENAASSVRSEGPPATPTPGTTPSPTPTPAPDLAHSIRQIGDELRQLHGLGIPLGWVFNDVAEKRKSVSRAEANEGAERSRMASATETAKGKAADSPQARTVNLAQLRLKDAEEKTTRALSELMAAEAQSPRDDDLYVLFSQGRWFPVTKLLGLLITALAASLGAPFWFDVLNKLMAVRGTGKPPATAAGDPRTGVTTTSK